MYVIVGIFFVLVYATTAANPDESSYACYYDKKRQTYLGDVYSVKWMENSDAVCDITYFSFNFFNAEFFQKSFVLLVMVIVDHGLVDELVSVWLHIDLQVDLTKETLMKQFQIVKEETNTSHVMQYGDMVYLFYMKRIRPPTPSSFPDYSPVPIYTPGCMVRVKCLV